MLLFYKLLPKTIIYSLLLLVIYFQQICNLHIAYKCMNNIYTDRTNCVFAFTQNNNENYKCFISGRLWVACSIFCRRNDNGSYYSPRFDLNDLGNDPYFPDGTLCHHNSKHNYYCMNHHCHPEVKLAQKHLR